jgi:hypothetical protein
MSRVAARPSRQGRPAPRDRDGRVGWEQLRPWLDALRELPAGALFCVIDGPTRGRPWSAAGVRVELRRLAIRAHVRRRFAPHQLRHPHAVELAREGVPLNVIQPARTREPRYDQHLPAGIDTEEIIATVHARRTPICPRAPGLQL